MDDHRPEPDLLLSALKQKNAPQTPLRLFLGMAAGVGKTYAMLKAAHKRALDGDFVLIGVVETHGRPETQKLLEGLPLLPKKKLSYHHTLQEEMDLDAILDRKPQLVIIDELAHTNIPGSRHKKRYQDVLEILDAGIEVYTALNVQHLESRKDAIEAITGIIIHETVPDSLLERASLVELVDIAPTELILRLQEGKIYQKALADRAIQAFFKEDQLTALREIALRITAERVDQDLQQFAGKRALPQQKPWQTNERLLVSITHRPQSEKLIRATRRLAYNLEAPWIALYVHTGLPLPPAEQVQLNKNLDLARELKAEVLTQTHPDLLKAIQTVCRQKNVTQLVMGKSENPSFWQQLMSVLNRSLIDQLLEQLTEVDLHIIHQKDSAQTPWQQVKAFFKVLMTAHDPSAGLPFSKLFGMVGGCVTLGMIFSEWLHYEALGFLFLLAVFWVSLFGSWKQVWIMAFLSGGSWVFFFIPPTQTFFIQNPNDLFLCLAFLTASLFTGFVTNRIQWQQKMIRHRENQTQILYETLRDIVQSPEKSTFLSKITQRLGLLLEGQCGLLLKNQSGELSFAQEKSYHPSLKLAEKDRTVALWCYENQRLAGWSTETLSETQTLFVPLQGSHEKIGVLLFSPTQPKGKLTLDQTNLLHTLAEQLGVSLERHFLQKRLLQASKKA